MTCERLWWLRYDQGIVPIHDKKDRMGGTLIHLALAYYYASLMPTPPSWFHEKDLNAALEEKGVGFPDLIPIAKEVLVAYMQTYPQETFKPVTIEKQFVARVGDLDPGGPDPSLDDELVSCRPDLIAEIDGKNYMVDHKSSGGGWGRGKALEKWNPNGNYLLDWQVLWNLHIVRQTMPIEGFIIQRLKRSAPYQVDRNFVSVAAKPYGEAPRVGRAAVARERENKRRAEAGIPPIPAFWACFGRFGACFLPETLVTTTDGPKPIEELRPGTRVLTHRNRFRSVAKTMGRWYDGEIVELSIGRRKSLPLTATTEHPILVQRDEKSLWLPINDVKVGDQVLVPHCVGEAEETPLADEEKAELLGLFLAEGHASGYVGLTRDSWAGTRVVWTFGRHEEALVERTVELIRKVHGIEPVVNQKASVTVVKLNDAASAVYYMRAFGHKAPFKRLPPEILNASRNIVLAFMRGWMLGDGGQQKMRIYGTTSSKRMTIQWLGLLARHDIHPTSFANNRDGGWVTRDRQIKRRYTQHMISFSGGAFEAIAPTFGREFRASIHNVPAELDGRRLYSVVGVTRRDYEGPVYNLEVADDHTYVADGYIVHNCDYRPLCLGQDVMDELYKVEK